jgi:hypothetical protein
MQRVLSFEQSPSLFLPLRYFLTAPLFLIAATLLLLWVGPDALSSRWSPFTLALTHLLTLGVLANTMIGALFQILPVVAGIEIPRPNLTATIVHAFLTIGTILLANAFWLVQPVLFQLAIVCLATAFGWLFIACAMGLWQTYASNASATVIAIRLAVVSLLMTVILGIAIASVFAWQINLPLLQLTDLHALWGLSGWVGLLVMGVAFQVIPMFQVTQLYPQWLTRSLTWGVFALLVLRSIATMTEQHVFLTTALSACIMMAFVAFAWITLSLLWRRKRPKADPTTLFWRTAMASLIGSAIVWVIQSATDYPVTPITLGVLFIAGFALSAINGMLYKIVPFLLWYHAQSNAEPGNKSTMSIKKILPDSIAHKQFYAHVVALLLLVAATIWPNMVRVAAVMLLVSTVWLEINLLNAVRLYLRARRISSFVRA